MKKSVVFSFVLLVGILILSSNLIIAQEDEKSDNLKCVTCGDGCYTTEDVAVMYCGPPTGEVECGVEDGECVVLSIEPFEDDFQTEWDGTCGDFDCDELEIVGGGITPDSIFYFLDGLFEGCTINSKEERVSEIKLMIEAEKYEEAHIALEKYEECAEELLKEVNPEDKEEAVKSAETIKKVLRELEEQIDEEERENFVGNIVESEENIATAAEIAGKIKELCEQLSELNPSEYYSVCKSGDDSPDWQKKLDKELTKEQREEAKKFGKIMENCFKSSGEDCACEEIPYSDFADACSTAAPLAMACDLKGDEVACEKLDNLDMPRLPPHLEDIMDDLEDDMMDSKFDLHMPQECVEAGVTNPGDCGKIMIETNAPEECREALLAADVQSEREGREICDKIMMEIHSPECAEQGISDPEDCRDLMDNFRGPGLMEGGPRIDFDCGKIEDPMERLDCYDKASSQAQSYGGFDDDYEGDCMTESDWRDKKEECRDLFGEHAGDEPIMGDSGEGYECVIDARCIDFGQGKMDFEEIKERERECAESCEREDKAWDFSYGECECYGGDYEDYKPEDYNRGPGCNDCSSQCPEGAYTDCVNDRCVCGDVPYTGPQYSEGEGPGEPGDYDNNGEPPSYDDGGGYSASPVDSGRDDNSGRSGGSEPSGDDGRDDDSGGDSHGGGAGITGNAFLDYWYD